MTNRAVVLARGLARRMQESNGAAILDDAQRRAADAGQKGMMPIAGRPFLDFVLSTIADAGLTRVALIVAPEHRAFRDHYVVEHPPERLRLDFIVQPEPLGTADAVLAAEGWTTGDPFLVMNSDNLYPAEVLRQLADLTGPGLPVFTPDELVRTSNIAPERICTFALLEIDPSGHLLDIVEKPSAGRVRAAGASAAVSMNCWRFDSRIFDFCRTVPRSARGEFELPEAVAHAVKHGIRFRTIPARGPVLDLSRRADAADVAHRLGATIPRP
jgi:dTDP-glucose pyrophosphorylase